MKISFIIPCYNVPFHMLRECVESLLALPLSKEEREVIVIDDGSESPLELNDYPEVQLHRQENQGLSAARNSGIALATGDYIQFVDADDALILKPYTAVIQQARDTGADIIHFRLAHTPAPASSDRPTFQTADSGVSFMMQHNLRATACGYLFRRNLLGSDLRFADGLLHEDEDFTPRLFIRAKRTEYTFAPAYYYRLRTDSITHRPTRRHIVRRLADTLTILRRLDALRNSVESLEAKDAMQRRVAQLTADLLYNTCHLTHSPLHLEHTVARLRRYGLLPLPAESYTPRYALFRLLMQLRPLRALLALIL